MKQAVFRCRATAMIGGGHVVRCLALAGKLLSLGWRCSFAVNPEAVDVVGALAREPVDLRDLNDTGDADLLVVDDYDVDALLESELGENVRTVLSINDLANRSHRCDVLLDPTFGRQISDYDGLVPSECRRLLGPGYALIRDAFAAHRRNALTRRGNEVERILVTPGQVDHANLAGMAIAALKHALPHVAVDIVVGAAAPHRAMLAAQAGDNVKLHVDIDGAAMAELMVGADLAIGAGGGGVWERCVMGLPTVVVVVADNQADVAAGLARIDAAVVAGRIENLDAEGLGLVISDLVRQTEKRHAIAAKSATLCDGRGLFRTVAALVPPNTTSDGSPVRFRAAETGDDAIMYGWQKHPQTRRHARNPSVPTWDEHRAWLSRKLEDNGCLFTIVEQGKTPVGLLRLDRDESGYEVSIVVAPEHHGIGVGTAALSLGRDLVPGHVLTAFVKPQNTASEKLFRNAGYKPDGHGFYRQLPVAA